MLKPFKLEKGWTRKDDTPQREAVREAFTNAIIHCDLMADAGILRIEKHDDRLCFRNPGLLKLPVEAIYRGGNSKARGYAVLKIFKIVLEALMLIVWIYCASASCLHLNVWQPSKVLIMSQILTNI
jgi:hypothetical protein